MNQSVPLEIDVHTLDEMRRSGTPMTILDVREPGELTICRFPDSVNIPMNTVPERLDMVPSDGTLVVVCHLGMRSQQVAVWLRQQGYDNAVNLSGGIDAWARQVDRSMPVY